MTNPLILTRTACLACGLLFLAGQAPAQSVAFGGGNMDPDAPVEVESDNLSVDQTDGTAEFTGDVLIVQGGSRLSAPRVLVVYNDDQSAIRSLQATGGVTLVSGEDAAEASQADYDLEAGVIVMQGDVLLVQGESTLTAQTMRVDLNAGTAQMDGRVRTVLQPGGQ